MITKDEALEIRKVYPNAELRRTCKQKSKRHRIYCPCVERYMRIIADSNVEASKIVAEIDERLQRKRLYQQRRGNADDR